MFLQLLFVHRSRHHYQYDIAENKSTVYTAPKIKFDLDKYTTQQVFVTSKDGTRVPMFLTYKKDLKRNGKNPRAHPMVTVVSTYRCLQVSHQCAYHSSKMAVSTHK